MKKWLIYAAALLAFCGCEDSKDPDNNPPIPDAVTVAPERETFSSKGGSTEVIVTSSSQWTLTGEYDWVTPSAKMGKDGDIVKFTVKANETDKDKVAEYTFTVGSKTAKFTLTCKKVGVIVNEISISSEKETVGSDGGSVEVLVTSSDTWTLTGEFDWVTPSVMSGKDGDIVKFAVKPNTVGKDLTADFTFTVGDQTAPFTVVSASGSFLELASEKDVTISEKGGQLEVLLNTNLNYRELAHAISESGNGWLSYAVTLAGDGMTGAKMYFKVEENTTYEGRNSVITISYPDGPTVTVNVAQKPKTRLETDKDMFIVEIAGGSLEIPIRANVAYTIEVEESAKSWITPAGKVDDKEMFTIAPGEAFRKGIITFASEGLSLPVTVVQKPDALINIAASMATNWAWPAWTDATPVTNMTSFTLEALVCNTSFKNANSLSTIMGIEGKFLIRLGDVGAPSNQMQVVYDTGKKGSWGNVEGKISNANMKLPTLNTWYHIAVTYVASTSIKVYIDGKEVGSATTDIPASVHFGVPHSDESAPSGQTITRCFWVGYAYEGARDFKGMMSEIRIWNKPLTPEQLNEGNHFWQVDPTSEGLVTYWKFNDGVGGTVKDHTSYKNDLTARTDLDWKVVSVPE